MFCVCSANCLAYLLGTEGDDGVFGCRRRLIIVLSVCDTPLILVIVQLILAKPSPGSILRAFRMALLYIVAQASF